MWWTNISYFVTDNWSSFFCVISWIGVKTVSAMCWGMLDPANLNYLIWCLSPLFLFIFPNSSDKPMKGICKWSWVLKTDSLMGNSFPPLNWRFNILVRVGNWFLRAILVLDFWLLLQPWILIFSWHFNAYLWWLWHFSFCGIVSVYFFLTFINIIIRLLMTATLSLLLMNFSLRHLYYMKKKLR